MLASTTNTATFYSVPVLRFAAALTTMALQQNRRRGPMKKQKKAISSPTRPVRSLDRIVLTEAHGGDSDSVPATGDPYVGHQHNETLIRSVRARRGSGARTRRTQRR
jgi:hypothetical protein